MKFIAILLSVFLITSGTAQHCIDERYGEEALFDTTQVDTLTNLTYGFSTHYFTNAEIELKMDVFMPAQDIDPLEQRPFILMIHGGGFAGGSRAEMNNECFGYAQRGFVAATISYRVGWNCDNVICFNCFGSNLQKAIYCAVQDARAAMRFAYDQKEEWGIDENWMFIGGESA
jgi:carboxylesterase type B